MKSITTMQIDKLKMLAEKIIGGEPPVCHLFGVQSRGSSSLKDAYDDLIGIVDYNRRCGIVSPGTVDPGAIHTLHPDQIGKVGVAHLDFGWHKDIWEIGMFKKSVPRLTHKAFLSIRYEEVHRDTDKNGIIDEKDLADKADGICHHWGWGGSVVGTSSDGCQVDQFINDLNAEIRLAEDSGLKVFSYLLLKEEEFPQIFL
jgi:hypothetical protein